MNKEERKIYRHKYHLAHYTKKGYSHLKGDGANRWNGGRFKNCEGYVKIYCPNHPYKPTTSKYMLEHRLLMEKKLGRYLKPEEVVHHKNDIIDDNRIENLRLFKSNKEPDGICVCIFSFLLYSFFLLFS